MITQKSEIPEWLTAEVASLAAAAAPSEQIIALLAQNEIPKPYAMWMLKKALGMSMAQAQLAVHYSEGYADRRASDETFHDSISKSFELLNEQDQTASAA